MQGLTRGGGAHLCVIASWPDGRCSPVHCGPNGQDAPGVEESPGSMEIRRRITSGRGDPRDSATESKPLDFRIASLRKRLAR